MYRRKLIISPTLSPQSSTSPPVPNPFFGKVVLKKTPVHVKDDFNPFKFNKVAEASAVSAYRTLLSYCWVTYAALDRRKLAIPGQTVHADVPAGTTPSATTITTYSPSWAAANSAATVRGRSIDSPRICVHISTLWLSWTGPSFITGSLEVIRVICFAAYDAWYGTTTSRRLHSWTLRTTDALSSFYAPTER